MAYIQGSVNENASRMSGNEEPEIYSMRGYHGDRPQNYNVPVMPGQDREPGYGMPPMTNREMHLPRAHLMSHPQERAAHEDNTYRHQGDNFFNVVEGQGYGVLPMKSSESNVYSAITSQPEAYAGQITTSDQRITPTTASGPNTSDLDALWQSTGWLIFKRVTSIVFMITDIVLAWEQVIEMDKISYSSYFWYLIKPTETGCPPVQPVIVTYKVIMSFCTLFTIAQIINVIGETVFDMTEGKHGFQLIHGFNEVVVKTIIKDIPQFLLMFVAVFFKCTCTSPADRWVLFIAVTLIPMFSCSIRQMTCKQEVKNWCRCECRWECNTKCQNPLEECGCTCPYLCCYLPIRTKLFKPCVPLSFCKLLGCCVNGGFKLDFTPRSKDPVFAIQLCHKLDTYLSILIALNIVLTIIRCDVPFKLYALDACQIPIFRCL